MMSPSATRDCATCSPLRISIGKLAIASERVAILTLLVTLLEAGLFLSSYTRRTPGCAMRVLQLERAIGERILTSA